MSAEKTQVDSCSHVFGSVRVCMKGVEKTSKQSVAEIFYIIEKSHLDQFPAKIGHTPPARLVFYQPT